MKLFLYAEVAVWFIRSAIFSIGLSGSLVFDIINSPASELVRETIQQSIVIIISSLVVSLLIWRPPQFRPAPRPSDLIVFDQYYLGLFATLAFLFEGRNKREVIRNIALLPGLKRISIAADNSMLFIESVNGEKPTDRLITIIVLVAAIMALLLSPFLITLIYYYIGQRLSLIGLPITLEQRFLRDFTMIITYYAFFLTPSGWYTSNAVSHLAKKIDSYYHCSVYTSPLVPFTGYHFNANKITLAASQKNSIYIDPNIIKDEIIYNFVIAHEAGHVMDKVFKMIRILVMPILFPWGIFGMLLLSDYLYIKISPFTGHLVTMIGIITIGVSLVLYFILEKSSELRADDFAVKQLGVKPVITAMEDLSRKFNWPDIDKRLKRIKQKWSD